MSKDLIIAMGLLMPGITTALGAVPVFFTRSISRKWLDALLGFAAGVILAATAFSLILPSIEYGGGTAIAVLVTAVGIIVGALLIDLVDHFSPHEHLLNKHHEGAVNTSLSKIWLFIIAITIHNIPEGMAVGVAFGSGDIGIGLPIAIGISLQNMPEGLAVAVSLLREGYSKRTSFIVAALTGLVEPIAAVLGYFLVGLFNPLLPFALAFAGGAMLFVISDEIIPETHANDNQRVATWGLMIGFVIMMVMDILLG